MAPVSQISTAVSSLRRYGEITTETIFRVGTKCRGDMVVSTIVEGSLKLAVGNTEQSVSRTNCFLRRMLCFQER